MTTLLSSLGADVLGVDKTFGDSLSGRYGAFGASSMPQKGYRLIKPAHAWAARTWAKGYKGFAIRISKHPGSNGATHGEIINNAGNVVSLWSGRRAADVARSAEEWVDGLNAEGLGGGFDGDDAFGGIADIRRWRKGRSGNMVHYDSPDLPFVRSAWGTFEDGQYSIVSDPQRGKGYSVNVYDDKNLHRGQLDRDGALFHFEPSLFRSPQAAAKAAALHYERMTGKSAKDALGGKRPPWPGYTKQMKALALATAIIERRLSSLPERMQAPPRIETRAERDGRTRIEFMLTNEAAEYAGPDTFALPVERAIGRPVQVDSWQSWKDHRGVILDFNIKP